MPFQVAELFETVGANVAFKRTFVLMRLQIVREVVQSFEPMRLLSCMTQQMFLEVAQLLARLGAKVALVNSVFFLQRVR